MEDRKNNIEDATIIEEVDYTKVLTGGNGEEVVTTPNKKQQPIEKKELTEEEKRAQEIQLLKNSIGKFKATKNYGVKYHKTRQKKNKMQGKSRKNNR